VTRYIRIVTGRSCILPNNGDVEMSIVRPRRPESPSEHPMLIRRRQRRKTHSEPCGGPFALAVKRDEELVKRAIGINLRLSGQTPGRLGVGDLRLNDRCGDKVRSLTLDRQAERNLAKLLHVLVDVGVTC
jgi:hypothetical protein